MLGSTIYRAPRVKVIQTPFKQIHDLDVATKMIQIMLKFIRFRGHFPWYCDGIFPGHYQLWKTSKICTIHI